MCLGPGAERGSCSATLGWHGGEEAGLSLAKEKGEAECGVRHAAGSEAQTEALAKELCGVRARSPGEEWKTPINHGDDSEHPDVGCHQGCPQGLRGLLP